MRGGNGHEKSEKVYGPFAGAGYVMSPVACGSSGGEWSDINVIDVCDTVTYSADECSTYYADSAMYDGVSYRVLEFDEDIIIRDDDYTYYRMDDKEKGKGR